MCIRASKKPPLPVCCVWGGPCAAREQRLVWGRGGRCPGTGIFMGNFKGKDGRCLYARGFADSRPFPEASPGTFPLLTPQVPAVPVWSVVLFNRWGRGTPALEDDLRGESLKSLEWEGSSLEGPPAAPLGDMPSICTKVAACVSFCRRDPLP